MSSGPDLMLIRHQLLGKHDITIHQTPFLSIDCMAYDRIGGMDFIYFYPTNFLGDSKIYQINT